MKEIQLYMLCTGYKIFSCQFKNFDQSYFFEFCNMEFDGALFELEIKTKLGIIFNPQAWSDYTYYQIMLYHKQVLTYQIYYPKMILANIDLIE